MKKIVNDNVVKIDSIENITVSSSVLEKILLISSSRIRQLTIEGILVRVGHGKYNLVQSMKNYIKHIKVNYEIDSYKSDGELDYEVERAKNERIKRKQNELKYALMKGRLHEAAQVEYLLSEMLVNFRTKLLGLPSKTAPLLTGKHETWDIKAILTNEVIEVLNELKDYDPVAFQNDNYIDHELLDNDLEDEEQDENHE